MKASAAGTAALAAASVLPGCNGSEKKAKSAFGVELNISFQEGTAPGENLSEKLDFMESLGVTGFEPGGRGLGDRVEEIKAALTGRNIKVSAICAGFKGFILAEDPVVKELFDTTMREIIVAAGIPCDRRRIGHQAHIERFLPVQRLKDHCRAVFQGEVSKLTQLFAEIITRFESMRLARSLGIERRNHDHSGRTELSGSDDDLAHRCVEQLLDSRILRQDESLETCANS